LFRINGIFRDLKELDDKTRLTEWKERPRLGRTKLSRTRKAKTSKWPMSRIPKPYRKTREIGYYNIMSMGSSSRLLPGFFLASSWLLLEQFARGQ
jgi:hypothetical protein